MFSSFSNKIQKKVSDLSRKKKLTPEELKAHLKDIRLILLEADVNYQVAKEFLKNIEIRASNEDILNGLNPGEQVVKIVRDEILDLFGNHEEQLNINKSPSLMMMVGLQGSGKTTTTGKIASFLRKKNLKKKILLIAADVYRPAAIEQLKTLGRELSIDVYSEAVDESNLKTDQVVNIVSRGISKATSEGYDHIIIDTAGRLHIDDNMLNEINQINKLFSPDEILLVIDGGIGQEAVQVGKNFKEAVPITGIVATKLDGDTRGGATMSVVKVCDAPIKFIGVSEKMDGLEKFDPNRMVSRILGMGDILGLVEKIEDYVSHEEQQELEKKLRKNDFTLDDFLKQMKMMKRMGGLGKLIGMIPGANKLDLTKIDENKLISVQAIIESMTPHERQNPKVLNASRRVRIANGSGSSVAGINQLIKGYEQSKKMMSKMKNMDMNDPESLSNLMKNLK